MRNPRNATTLTSPINTVAKTSKPATVAVSRRFSVHVLGLSDTGYSPAFSMYPAPRTV